MPRLIVVTRDGVEHEVEARVHLSVMENIRSHGFDELQALCGGGCSCATCHIYIDAPTAVGVPPASDDENDLLDGSHARSENSRLSCQVLFSAAMDGLRVTIAPED